MSILLNDLITNTFKMRLMAWYWLEPISNVNNWYRIVIADGLSPNWHRASAATSRNYIKLTCQNSAGVNNQVSTKIHAFYITENTVW